MGGGVIRDSRMHVASEDAHWASLGAEVKGKGSMKDQGWRAGAAESRVRRQPRYQSAVARATSVGQLKCRRIWRPQACMELFLFHVKSWLA